MEISSEDCTSALSDAYEKTEHKGSDGVISWMKNKQWVGRREETSERALGCVSLSLTHNPITSQKGKKQQTGLRVELLTTKFSEENKHCQILKSKTILVATGGILTHQGHGFTKFNSCHLYLFLALHLEKSFTLALQSWGQESSSEKPSSTNNQFKNAFFPSVSSVLTHNPPSNSLFFSFKCYTSFTTQ